MPFIFPHSHVTISLCPFLMGIIPFKNNCIWSEMVGYSSEPGFHYSGIVMLPSAASANNILEASNHGTERANTLLKTIFCPCNYYL